MMHLPMRLNRWLRLCLLPAVGVALALAPHPARADDDGHRFGLIGVVGGGVAGVVHPGVLSSGVAFTDLGAEIMGEVRPWGGFLRTDYLSSGDGSRWTAFSFTGGAEYRLFGDTHHTALFLRGGLAYERWMGNNTGCPIDLFVPNSCNLIGAMSASFNVQTDMIGIVAGARVEAPISAFYLAGGLNFVPVVAIDSTNPAAAFELRLTLEIGFRDARTKDADPGTRFPSRTRTHSESTTPFGN